MFSYFPFLKFNDEYLFIIALTQRRDIVIFYSRRPQRNMSCDTGGMSKIGILIFIPLCFLPVVIYCGDDFEIPGPHFPIAAGAPGDELINSGTVPEFLSYRAKDQNGLFFFSSLDTRVLFLLMNFMLITSP